MTAISGLFYGSNKMATDVDVQYFSHLNSLTLGNNWGDLIRMLDKALVTGIDFTQITAASIDEQGDVHITLYSAHNALLFQVVELSGFTPNSLNQKYRIKGVPNSTQLILKPALDISERSITTIGGGKLASLGYDIIFRDTNDVKRVYRAKNPTAQHPFIRVDETISDGANSYTSTYAKSAMVGLIENMTHIDDYLDPNKLQLPLDIADFAKNWKVTGAGASVVRGWSKWYWATMKNGDSAHLETSSPLMGSRPFTFIGNKDAFYFMPTVGDLNGVIQPRSRRLYGVGIFDSSLEHTIPPWFLMTSLTLSAANVGKFLSSDEGGTPLAGSEYVARFLCPAYNPLVRVSDTSKAIPILPNYQTGITTIFARSPPGALQIPFYDTSANLRGTLKHVCFRGINTGINLITPQVAENSMYISDCYEINWSSNIYQAVNYYLGELE
jgi:hypothetical protein